MARLFQASFLNLFYIFQPDSHRLIHLLFFPCKHNLIPHFLFFVLCCDFILPVFTGGII